MVVGIYEQSKNQMIDVVTTVDRNAISPTLFGFSSFTFRNATGRENEHVCVSHRFINRDIGYHTYIVTV